MFLKRVKNLEYFTQVNKEKNLFNASVEAKSVSILSQCMYLATDNYGAPMEKLTPVLLTCILGGPFPAGEGKGGKGDKRREGKGEREGKENARAPNITTDRRPWTK